MIEPVWKFSTRNFHVSCVEYEPDFVDPLVHSKDVLAALQDGLLIITHVSAYIYFRGTEVGRASLNDCVYLFADTDNPYGHDRLIVTDRSYRRKIVRGAIKDARKNFPGTRSDWLGL